MASHSDKKMTSSGCAQFFLKMFKSWNNCTIQDCNNGDEFSSTYNIPKHKTYEGPDAKDCSFKRTRNEESRNFKSAIRPTSKPSGYRHKKLENAGGNYPDRNNDNELSNIPESKVLSRSFLNCQPNIQSDSLTEQHSSDSDSDELYYSLPDIDDYDVHAETNIQTSPERLMQAFLTSDFKMAPSALVSDHSNDTTLDYMALVEQMFHLSSSNEETSRSSVIRGYLQQAGISSTKAKSFLKWLYLNEESLKQADKVCIGYESQTPDEPVYLALYPAVVPSSTCPKLYNMFQVIHRTIGCVSEEGKKISDMEINRKLHFSKVEQNRLHECLSKVTTILMSEHSNLLMVGASNLKSEGFGTTYPRVLEKTCIVMYVDVKGFIPFGEKPFPKQVEEFPVDVREGVFRIFSDPKDFHESLVMGCQIVTSYNTCGTLGAFVQLRDGYLGCLTCCHVFETPQSVIDYKRDTTLSLFKTAVYQPEPSDNYKVGNVLTFIQDPGDEDTIGADVALIVLNSPQRYPKKGDFPDLNCAIAGFSVEKPMIFNSGEIIQSFDEIKLPCHVVKYGATTGLTIGHLHSYGSAVQVSMSSFYDDKVRLHQQLEVISIEEPFAQEGDSGSLVFCVCKNGETTVLKALGLLVGGGSNGHVVVTPIWAILGKLQLPLQLYCFNSSHRKLNAADFENHRLNKLEAEVGGLKVKLDDLSVNMAKKEDIHAIASSMLKKEDIDRIFQQTNSSSNSKMITDV